MDHRARRVGDENAIYGSKSFNVGGAPPNANAPLGIKAGPKRAALQTVTNTARAPLGAKSSNVRVDERKFARSHVQRTDSQPVPASVPLSAVPSQQPAQPLAAPESDDTIEDYEMDQVQELSVEDESGLDHDHSHILADDNVLEHVSLTNPHALFPIQTPETIRDINRCAEVVRQTPGILDEEDEDMYDTAMVTEYSEEIFMHMRRLELQMRPDPGYMDHQREIQWSMRAVLIDWLVQVHHRFNLLPETLYLTINYIDRFLSVKDVSLSKFQLVGAVALFLAAKYEEIHFLSVQEVAYMVENGFSVDEILKAERYMIDMLDFNLGYPGPMSFLRRTSKADDYDLETRTLAKYLLEITIMDHRFVAAPPSWTGAIAHYVAREMLNKGEWTDLHVYFSGYTEKQLLPGVKALKEDLRDPLTNHKAVFEKYSERRFKRCALYAHDWVNQYM